MRKQFLQIMLFVIAGFGFVSSASAQQLAFPGAEGFGKYATGGRTGSVYHVTNLNDAGTGSLRDAVSSSNRIIVFDVAGVITLTSGGLIASPNLYIAGQTAPGEGITVYGNRITFTGADNTICRYIRFRMGVVGTAGKDAVALANGKDMIFDHISASWGRDETFSINWDGKGTEPTNITISNSIISQGLLLHSAGGLIQSNGGITLFRNLYADNSTRNNKVKGVVEFVNNIVYNWNNAAYIMGGDSDGSSYVNVFGNYFIDGPSVGGTPISDGNADYHIYGEDNWFDKNRDGVLNGYLIPHSEYSGGPDFQTAPYDYPAKNSGIAASGLISSVLPSVGASLPYRDYADYYVVNEVQTLGLKGELLSTESTLPFGAPSSWALWAGTTRTDTDKDGMPDAWETANGLNANLASDAMTIASNGYANIENYINSLTTESASQPYLRTPLNLSVKRSTPSSITFKWLDYTRDETGFVLERLVNQSWVVVGNIAANIDTFQLTGLAAEEKDTFRVKAVNASLVSSYSTQLIAKSRPVPPTTPNLTPDLTWTGTASSTWDKSSLNFVNQSNVAVAFYDSTRVQLGPGTLASNTITMSGTLGIKGLIVSSDNDYTLQGTGSLSGKGWIYKTGKGNLSLLTTNTNTLQTVINGGTVTINSLANGGVASSIGQSSNSMYNLDLNGGKLDYTGATTATDRNILLEQTSEFSVSNSSAVVTMNGVFTGEGGLIKSGTGTLKLYNGKGNDYQGETTIAGGTLEVDLQQALTLSNVLGTTNMVNLAGGTIKFSNGQSSGYETYSFNINVPDGKVGGIYPAQTCSLQNKIIGSGTLVYTIPYLREYITGDWSGFTGVLTAYGVNTAANGGSQLLLYNSVGMPNTRLNLTGNAKIINWATTGTMRLGGLSGIAGTFLGSSSKQTDGTIMNWIVGGAGTDETFNGIINNDCSASGHYGVTNIEKEGVGIWRLTGANVYSGTTTVSDGKLIVNGANSGTGAVSVKAGGTLAGTGSLAGAVTVDSAGIVEPGDGGIGTLTLKSSLTMSLNSVLKVDINKTTSTADKVAVTGTASINGVLNISLTGTPVVGDQYTIITAGTLSGTFSSIVPASPGTGLIWKYSAGVLQVASVTTYTLSSTVVGSGSISPASGSYNSGTVVTLTATPSVGYLFSGWSGSLTGTTNPATLTMDANKTVTATFTQLAATLTMGGVGASSQVVTVGSAIASFYYTWANATSATATGLPSGVVATLNTTAQTITISGTPTVAGTYNYTIATMGGATNASITGTITVNNITSTLIYQGENAVINTGVTEAKNTGYVGTGYANTDNAIGTYVEWTVTTSTAGSFNILFRYSSVGARPADVYVNGTKVISALAFPTTTLWTTWTTTATQTVTLLNGANAIRTTATTTGGCANIDYLQVTGSGTLKSLKIDDNLDGEKLNDDIVVYPNPVVSVINLKGNMLKSGNVNVFIYNYQGKLIRTKNFGIIESGSFDLNVLAESFSSGMYIIKLQTGNVIKSMPFVKE